MHRLARGLRDDAAYWGLRLLLGGARFVPLGVLRAAGAVIGRIALRFSRRDRRRALAHLAAAFPEHDAPWRRRLVARCTKHLGTLLGEVAWLWSASPEALLARTEFVGLENLTGALGPDGGALLVTGHCGNWEWLNLGLGARGVPMSVAAKEVYDPRLDEVARRLRGRFGGESALRGRGAGTKLVQALRNGRVVGILIDQDIDAPGAFVEFFGQPAWTPTGAALLAVRTGRPVVTGFATRLPDGRMRLAFAPAMPVVQGPGEDAEVAPLTAVLTRRIEDQVRAHPDQWVWMHRRWKHQPGEDEPVWRAGGGPGAGAGGPQGAPGL